MDEHETYNGLRIKFVDAELSLCSWKVWKVNKNQVHNFCSLGLTPITLFFLMFLIHLGNHCWLSEAHFINSTVWCDYLFSKLEDQEAKIIDHTLEALILGPILNISCSNDVKLSEPAKIRVPLTPSDAEYRASAPVCWSVEDAAPRFEWKITIMDGYHSWFGYACSPKRWNGDVSGQNFYR